MQAPSGLPSRYLSSWHSHQPEEARHQSYSERHAFTCGGDPLGRSLYLCVLDRAGQLVFQRNLSCKEEAVLDVLAPSREDLVAVRDCIFC